MFSRLFQRFTTSPQIPKIVVGKTRTIRSRLATVEQARQKNRNGKTIAVLFHYECIEGKSGIWLLFVMCIGDDWMLDLMIIYIEKTIAKALDINDIIKNIMGMSARWVQVSQQIIKFDHLLKFENKIYIGYFHIMRSTPLGLESWFHPCL